MHNKVLIVEDNPIARITEQALMEGQNLMVDCVESGELALTMIEKNHYHLIIMDIGLPGINGVETTIKIRAYEGNNKISNVPIIAVTGNSDITQNKLYIQAGMNDVIAKPLTANHVTTLISKFLNK